MSEGLLLGVDSCGKTLLLRQLRYRCEIYNRSKKINDRNEISMQKLNTKVETTPTTGVEVDTMTILRKNPSKKNKRVNFILREVGAPMIPMWPSYFQNAHFLLYVVDMCNSALLSSSVIECLNILRSEAMQGKPVLLLLNKIIPMSTINAFFCIKEIKENWSGRFDVLKISANTGENTDQVVKWIDEVIP